MSRIDELIDTAIDIAEKVNKTGDLILKGFIIFSMVSSIARLIYALNGIDYNPYEELHKEIIKKVKERKKK